MSIYIPFALKIAFWLAVTAVSGFHFRNEEKDRNWISATVCCLVMICSAHAAYDIILKLIAQIQLDFA